ncbi:hypothetical protein NQ318_011595 [Aromia moschata]|uniref:Mos1 transposase HTH domain-containing protein n=1 Tax=Aromia moschata TaxID=1265417 RepID=A0AAV8Z8J1_9CUCU|nr:hypothetical protein NQ318_011595 [Aromia moschata]
MLSVWLLFFSSGTIRGVDKDDAASVLALHSVREALRLSLRRRAIETEISKSHLQRIFKQNRILPFKPKFRHTLEEGDEAKRLDFCLEMGNRVLNDVFVILGISDVSKNLKCSDGATEAYAMLKEVYGNECLSHIHVFEWFKRFKVGHETTEDEPRPGSPSTSKMDENIENIGKLIREDHRVSIRGLAEIIGIDKESVRQISPRPHWRKSQISWPKP